MATGVLEQTLSDRQLRAIHNHAAVSNWDIPTSLSTLPFFESNIKSSCLTASAYLPLDKLAFSSLSIDDLMQKGNFWEYQVLHFFSGFNIDNYVDGKETEFTDLCINTDLYEICSYLINLPNFYFKKHTYGGYYIDTHFNLPLTRREENNSPGLQTLFVGATLPDVNLIKNNPYFFLILEDRIRSIVNALDSGLYFITGLTPPNFILDHPKLLKKYCEAVFRALYINPKSIRKQLHIISYNTNFIEIMNKIKQKVY